MTPEQILDSLAQLLTPPQVAITIHVRYGDYAHRRIFGIVEQGIRRFAFEAWRDLPRVRARLYRKQDSTVTAMPIKFSNDLLRIIETSNTIYREFYRVKQLKTASEECDEESPPSVHSVRWRRRSSAANAGQGGADPPETAGSTRQA